MKTPIEVKDIRAGDLIRWESTDGDEAHESRIANPRATGFTEGRHYLLDRPTPPVELPTQPTLGWLSWRIERPNNDGTDLDFWSGPGSQRGAAMRGAEPEETHLYPADITAFTPATAVPQSAIEELEDAYAEWRKDAGRGLAADVAHFLNLIYEANGVDLS